MKKEYWLIIIAYIIMQFSSFIGVPFISLMGEALGISQRKLQIYSVSIWLVISFAVTLVIVLFLLRKEMLHYNRNKPLAPVSNSILWAVGGVFLALFAQGIAARIESLLGIEMGSENTQQIIHLINTYPIVILVTSIIGPMLEEIVFRKIIFGSLHKRFNFLISALISSVIFALAHGEPEHILLYSAMGFTFAFLYVKTNRILVPMFAHVAMNTFVVLVQSIYKNDLERMIHDAEKIQGFIGGL